MRKIIFLFAIVTLFSCESKSGKLTKPNASFTSEEVREDLIGNAPQSLTLSQMKAYQASGMGRMCGLDAEPWNTAVVKLYTAEDSAVYQWDKLEAKYIFITFKL